MSICRFPVYLTGKLKRIFHERRKLPERKRFANYERERETDRAVEFFNIFGRKNDDIFLFVPLKTRIA